MTGLEHDLTGAVWHKSTFSNNGGNCVEVARNLPGIVAVRDSKNPGPALVLGRAEWASLLTAVRTGELSG